MRLWLTAWFACAALWLVLTDSVRVEELLAGALVAALAATVLEVVRRQRIARQAFHPRLWLGTWRVLGRIPPDVWRLTRAAFAQAAERRPVRGRMVALPFGHSAEEPDDRGVRGVASRLGSVSPNSIVAGVDVDSGLLLVHQLEPSDNPDDLDPLRLR
jgi:multisubunit Na+/H+ antiporter MnhE subunit